MAGLIAVGVGFRAATSAEAIAALVRATLARVADMTGERALFTSERKRDDAAIESAAKALGLPLHYLAHEQLEAEAPRAATRSERVERHVGLPSLSETAALAGAGPGGVLIVARVAADGATCAIAHRAEANS